MWRATHCGAKMDGKEVISIHALRGEGDLAGSDKVFAIAIFQSTPSVGRATEATMDYNKRLEISIHALRGEGDAE